MAQSLETKTPILLALFLVFFFIIKLFHLEAPLFGDEMGVYGSGVFYLLDNGPSMLPGDVIPEISRGHPLFFIFFVSWLTSWFGESYIIARTVILFISITTLLATYFLGKELFNKSVGFCAALALAFQPLFFAQSTLILPEILLTLLITLSLLFYVRNQYGWYFLFASLAILTKETAIILFAGLILNEWYKDSFRISLNLIGRGLKWAAPFSCFILFLFVQKAEHGWFFFPYHTGFISFDINDIAQRLGHCCTHILIGQNKYLLTVAALVGVFVMNKKERIELFNKNFLLLAIGIMMVAFSSLNYFMGRYLLLLYPLILIGLFSIFIHLRIHYIFFVLYLGLTIPLEFDGKQFRADDDMNHVIVSKNIKRGIAELDKISQGKAVRVFAVFPEVFALRDVRYGYTTNPNYDARFIYSDSCDYILLGTNYINQARTFNPEIDHVENVEIYNILENPIATKKAGMEVIYENISYFHQIRVLKTNNKY